MRQLLNTLYILTPESYLSLQNEAISVKVGGAEKVRIPAHTIDAVYCFGNVTVSTPLIGFCGQRGISLVFLSEHGKFYGRIQGSVSGNILLRQRQFAAMDDPTQSTRYARQFLPSAGYDGRTAGAAVRPIGDHADQSRADHRKILPAAPRAGIVERRRQKNSDQRLAETKAGNHHTPLFIGVHPHRPDPSCPVTSALPRTAG